MITRIVGLFVLFFVCAPLTHARIERLYQSVEPAELVDRSSVIIVGRVAPDSVRKETSGESVNLIVSEVLKGQLDLITSSSLHDDFHRVVNDALRGQLLLPKTIRVVLRGSHHVVAQRIPFLSLSNPAGNHPCQIWENQYLTEADAAESRLWFLRYEPSPSTHYMVESTADVQPISDKEFFLLWLSPDPERSLKQYKFPHDNLLSTNPYTGVQYYASSHREWQIKDYLAKRDIELIKLIPFFEVRVAQLWPYVGSESLYEIEAYDEFMKCGAAAGSLLLKKLGESTDPIDYVNWARRVIDFRGSMLGPRWQSPQLANVQTYHSNERQAYTNYALRLHIITMLGTLKYKPAAAKLSEVLSNHNKVWQNVPRNWKDTSSYLPGEDRSIVCALSNIADPTTTRLITKTRDLWKTFHDDCGMLEACDSALVRFSQIEKWDGKQLLLLLDATKTIEQRRNIISLIGQLKYNPAASRLISILSEHRQYWLKVAPGNQRHCLIDSEQHQRQREDEALISALGYLGDRSARDEVAKMLSFWKARPALESNYDMSTACISTLARLRDDGPERPWLQL